MESIMEYMNPAILTAGSYQKLDVLDSCYAALSEGVGDIEVIRTTSSYTESMILEILENVKNGLIEIYKRILALLNNYIINTATLADKYRNLLIERMYKLDAPFIFKTYEYPKVSDPDYPRVFKAADAVERDVKKLMEKIIAHSLDQVQINNEIHKMIITFGQDALDALVSPYGDLRDSVRAAVFKKVRGKPIERKLTESDIDTFIREISRYKDTKDDLVRTKNNVLEDYTELKRTYMNLIKRQEAQSVGLKSLKYPEVEELKAADRDRFASINLSMTKLFDAYITIYKAAFDCKLTIIREKIEANRSILIELMSRTNVLTSLATKVPDRRRRPIVFDPGIHT